MNQFWQQLLGAVQFSAEGGDAARLLNQCMKQEMALTHVQGTPLGFTAWVPARQYKQIHHPARHARVRVRILRKRGVTFRLRRLRGRWGIPFGAVLFLFLVPWLQGCIWTVGYYNLSAQEAVRLVSALQENAITCGARPTSAQLAAARQKILLADSTYASLSFHFIKGRLIVEATEAEPKPVITDNDTPADIVAKKDGILYRMEVYSGYAVREVGQSVRQGDVIVSRSYTDERTGTTVTGRARAKIIASTQTTFLCRQPLQFIRPVPTGEVLTQAVLCCGSRQLSLNKEKVLPQPAIVTTRIHPLAPMGWALPLSVKLTTQTAMQDTKVTLTARQAAARARLACDEAAARQFADAEILSRNYAEQTQTDAVICTLTVTAREEIGKTVEDADSETLPIQKESS